MRFINPARIESIQMKYDCFLQSPYTTAGHFIHLNFPSKIIFFLSLADFKMTDVKNKIMDIDDLEDGEIESDEDDSPIIVSVTPAAAVAVTPKISEPATEKSTKTDKNSSKSKRKLESTSKKSSSSSSTLTVAPSPKKTNSIKHDDLGPEGNSNI